MSLSHQNCLTTSRRAQLQARLTRKIAQLDLLNDAYDDALGSGGVLSYRFDSGEGAQQTKFRSLEDMRKAISALESDINRLEQKLNHRGITQMNMRRY